MLSGKTPQISAQAELLMDRLVSATSSVSGFSSVNPTSRVSPRANPLSLAQVPATPKTAVLTASDVRRLPRLDGSPAVDVAAVLAQYRLVAGFKSKYMRPDDEKYGDILALEFLSLICDDPVLTP